MKLMLVGWFRYEIFITWDYHYYCFSNLFAFRLYSFLFKFYAMHSRSMDLKDFLLDHFCCFSLVPLQVRILFSYKNETKWWNKMSTMMTTCRLLLNQFQIFQWVLSISNELPLFSCELCKLFQITYFLWSSIFKNWLMRYFSDQFDLLQGYLCYILFCIWSVLFRSVYLKGVCIFEQPIGDYSYTSSVLSSSTTRTAVIGLKIYILLKTT